MELEGLSKGELITICQNRAISTYKLNRDELIKKLRNNERLLQWFNPFDKSYPKPEEVK